MRPPSVGHRDERPRLDSLYIREQEPLHSAFFRHPQAGERPRLHRCVERGVDRGWSRLPKFPLRAMQTCQRERYSTHTKESAAVRLSALLYGSLQAVSNKIDQFPRKRTRDGAVVGFILIGAGVGPPVGRCSSSGTTPVGMSLNHGDLAHGVRAILGHTMSVTIRGVTGYTALVQHAT